jgi:hypothetical protein
MMALIDFAILAPVPLQHLDSGEIVCRERGYVSFGSMKWELFAKVDEMRQGEKVPVLIYPSYESDVAKLTFKVGWTATYVKQITDREERIAEEQLYRPPTTVGDDAIRDSAMDWVIFWR